jgi:hypothetical protein
MTYTTSASPTPTPLQHCILLSGYASDLGRDWKHTEATHLYPITTSGTLNLGSYIPFPLSVCLSYYGELMKQ